MKYSLVYVALLTLVFSTELTPSVTLVRQAHYQTLEHVQFSNITEEDMCTLAHYRSNGNILSCVVACEIEPTCTSMTYDPSVGTCKKNIGDIYTFGTNNLTSSNDVHYVGKVKSDVTEGDWTLVFRGQSSNSLPIWGTYSNSTYLSDTDMSRLHPSVSSKLSDVTVPHYRSRWINLWPSNDIDQVKLELYESGSTVVRMIFNGSGSTSTDWFSYSRLLQVYPYTDLTTEPIMFTLKGLRQRRLIVSETDDYDDCRQYAWMMVLDFVENTCSWTYTSDHKWPRFLYSKAADARVSFSSNVDQVGDADVLAIFIKFTNNSHVP